MKTKHVIIGVTAVAAIGAVWYLKRNQAATPDNSLSEQQKLDAKKADAIANREPRTITVKSESNTPVKTESTGILKMLETVKAAADQGTIPIMKTPVPMPVLVAEPTKVYAEPVVSKPVSTYVQPIAIQPIVKEVQPILVAAPVVSKPVLEPVKVYNEPVSTKPVLQTTSTKTLSVIDEVYPQAKPADTTFYKQPVLKGITLYGLEGRIVRA